MTHPRGDISIKINGEDRTLRLTLGALAQIEDSLGGGDIAALQTRLKKPRVADIVLILHALLAGGGAPLAIEALKASDINLTDAARAIAKTFSALGEDEENASPGKRVTPPPPSSPSAEA